MRSMFITAQPFEFTHIFDVKIQKGVNRHGRAWVKGVISEDMENRYVEMLLSEMPVTITASDFQGNQQTLFQGILEDLRISIENGLKVMELDIMPYSRLLDMLPEIRVFQNLDLSFNELVAAVLAPFIDAYAIINAGDGQPISQMFVQYQETAWAFLVRMASMNNDVVMTHDSYATGGVRLYFGFPNKSSSDAPPLNPIAFEVKKNLGGYLYKLENKVLNIAECDAIYYVIKDRDIRELGEPVRFQQRQLYVTAIESVMEGGELLHSYTLMSRDGVKVPQSRNFGLIGASLSGTVSKVSGAHVKMKLDAAHTNDTATAKWHPFSTVYSSPDGSGWYAMPEVGDKLRLYFPTEIDNEAYSISAVHLNTTKKSGTTAVTATTDAVVEMDAKTGIKADTETFKALEDPRTDPDYKVISNANGKTIVLSPSAIYITCEGGSLLIEDGVGVTINSNYDISISGKQDINITSLEGEVSVIGKENVSIKQANAVVELSEEKVAFYGAEVRTK